MFISVKVITRSRQEKVELQPDGSYKIWTRAVPEKGKANERVMELLAKRLGRPLSRISVIRGRGSSKKTVELE